MKLALFGGKFRHKLITLADENVIEIDGFLLELESRQLWSLHSSRIRSFLSLTEWAKLKKVCNATSLEKLKAVSSNYIFTKSQGLFHLLDNHVYVNFKKVNNFFTCQNCRKEEATHIGYYVTFHQSNGPTSKYIVCKEPLPNGLLASKDIFKQSERELSIMDSIFSNTINEIEEQFVCTNDIDGVRLRYVTEQSLLKLRSSPIYTELEVYKDTTSRIMEIKNLLIKKVLSHSLENLEKKKSCLFNNPETWLFTKKFERFYASQELYLRRNIDDLVEASLFSSSDERF